MSHTCRTKPSAPVLAMIIGALSVSTPAVVFAQLDVALGAEIDASVSMGVTQGKPIFTINGSKYHGNLVPFYENAIADRQISDVMAETIEKVKILEDVGIKVNMGHSYNHPMARWWMANFSDAQVWNAAKPESSNSTPEDIARWLTIDRAEPEWYANRLPQSISQPGDGLASVSVIGIDNGLWVDQNQTIVALPNLALGNAFEIIDNNNQLQGILGADTAIDIDAVKATIEPGWLVRSISPREYGEIGSRHSGAIGWGVTTGDQELTVLLPKGSASSGAPPVWFKELGKTFTDGVAEASQYLKVTSNKAMNVVVDGASKVVQGTWSKTKEEFAEKLFDGAKEVACRPKYTSLKMMEIKGALSLSLGVTGLGAKSEVSYNFQVSTEELCKG